MLRAIKTHSESRHPSLASTSVCRYSKGAIFRAVVKITLPCSNRATKSTFRGRYMIEQTGGRRTKKVSTKE